MKKLLLGLILVITLFTFNVKAVELPEKTDHEKVTIYIFRGHGCSHCYDALNYFNAHAEEYSDYFEVKAYEVWNVKENDELKNAVAEYLNDTVSGVPYIVVGSGYSINGFAESVADEIIENALREYQNDEYEDIVAKLAEGKNYKQESLEDACINEGIVKKHGKYDGIIITAIFVIVIGGGAAFIAFSRKN